MRPRATSGDVRAIRAPECELYDLLVLRRGMSLSRFGRFVADAMSAALLP
jgi:hypothetical protein